MFSRIVMAVAVALLLGTAAHAAPLQATPGIFNGSGYGSSYTGPGGTTSPSNAALGWVVDGGNGAFDAFGFYNSGTAGLTQTRQVELLSGNVFRFFDSFANTSSQVITTTLNFFGNLGSDGDELVHTHRNGLIVSCEDDWTGHCGSDPVLALVSGNNGLGIASISPDRYNVSFSVSIAPGEVLSLLNFAFLASDENGPSFGDVVLAQATGLALLEAPRLEGLSAEQLATLANYTLAGEVPEPSGMALVLAGLAALGWRARRKV